MLPDKKVTGCGINPSVEEGDNAAFTCIYHRYIEDLYPFAYIMLFSLLKDL